MRDFAPCASVDGDQTEKPMPHQTFATVTANDVIIPDHHVLTCHAPEIAAQARPGHFVNVLIAQSGHDPLLRKPFSIYTADPATGLISILFSLVGPTTYGMARKRPGDTVDLVGPLGGRLFTPDSRPGATHIMVGGGYGVPPLVFLSRELRARDERVVFLIGARRKDLLLCEEELRDAGVEAMPCTEDGSWGAVGKVTDALAPLLAQHGDAPLTVYCCGPTPMMRAVAEMCLGANVPCQLSMEVSMPCGMGVCMACVIDLADNRRVRCCTDGPVFRAEEIRW
jgi:dihydroorotate dehydrogenase electron transfer subunit